jgi:hypothetical protein
LQNIAPISAPTGLTMAAPPPGLGIALAPANAPVLALTPAQVTTLASGNVTSINQLLGQLVSGNTSSQQLTGLVNTFVTPLTTAVPPTTLPPVGAPTPPISPPVVTGGGPTPPQPPAPTPAPPTVYEPTDKASRT